MKLEINLEPLANLIKDLKLSPLPWQSEVSIAEYDHTKWEQIRATGFEVPLEEVKPNSKGLLTYDGQQVLLYIKDTRKEIDDVLHHPENLQKVHFFDCKTLSDMKAKKKFERYVVTQRQTGTFLVDIVSFYDRIHKKDIETKLHVCKNCLSGINYRNYKELSSQKKDDMVKSFEISTFFKEFHYSFQNTPTRTDINAPVNAYPENWKEIADAYKRSSEWRCRECDIDLGAPTHRRLLHVHHTNGVKTDNNPNNLKVLCVECHIREPHHDYMRHAYARDLMALQQLRREVKHTGT
jgi:hypothetical protein